MARKLFAVAPDGSIVSTTTDNDYACMRLFKDSDGTWRRASAHGTWQNGRKAQAARQGSGTVLVAAIESKEEATTLAELTRAGLQSSDSPVTSTTEGSGEAAAHSERSTMTTASESSSTEGGVQLAGLNEKLAPLAAPAKRSGSRSSSKSSTAKSGTAKKATAKKAAAKKSTAKKAAAKKAAAKKSTAKKATAAKPRSTFPVLATQAACEKVMKANLESYKQYQVERDKNRSERGMEKHRLGYRTYKNAYTQLLGIRKAAGLGRRNAKG